MSGTDLEIAGFEIPDSDLSREQIIARNYYAVADHIHNENPESIELAVALYTDDISWEAPSRGLVLDNPVEILTMYRGIFETLQIKSVIHLRRFATETFVFEDQIVKATVVGNKMKNLPFGVGTDISLRLSHVFEMRNGKIAREIAYETWREEGAKIDHDFIPSNSPVINF